MPQHASVSVPDFSTFFSIFKLLRPAGDSSSHLDARLSSGILTYGDPTPYKGFRPGPKGGHLMALYPFLAEFCIDEAKKHGQLPSTETFRDQVERNQNLAGFKLYGSTPFLTKGLGRSYRLVACRVPMRDDELIAFLRVLPRGSKEYDSHFLSNFKKEQDMARWLGLPDDKNLKRIYDELTKKPAFQPPPPPAEREVCWLYSVYSGDAHLEGELTVFETKSWTEKMLSPRMREFLAAYHGLLEETGLSGLHESNSDTDYHEAWDSAHRLGFAYVFRPDHRRLLLIEPLQQSDDPKALLRDYLGRAASIADDPQFLCRIAARSYPYLMTLDSEAWREIQKNDEANLALSPEEGELLDSVRRGITRGEPGYPLFINGRAGSGKSTMLQYLAADYIDFALRNPDALEPIYLTGSRELLERARQTVKSLLRTHFEKLFKGRHDEAAVDSIISRTFVVFHDYLYSRLSPDERSKLDREKFVGYADFRRLWLADFARRQDARKVSVDIAWHTIRSYIKGMRSGVDDDLTPAEFATLPKKSLSVSIETYELIYEQVWESWYRNLCKEQGYWDDQDLAAILMDWGGLNQDGYGALLCDEAQDFTPIELEIVLRLSVFSRRSLSPEQLRMVPFVFAGDPLQTVNPTGFRWEAFQAVFHDRFCAVLDPRRRGRVEINCKELRFNYRSNPGVAYFGNLIQLLRAALIGSRGIEPQDAWWVEAPVQPCWFALESSQTAEQLRKRPDLVKVVNCEEGQETDYASHDSVLSGLERDGEGVFRNILGPARAKGLEFPGVVVYRFGENPPQDFHRLLSGEVDVRDNPEAALPHEYFLNRLYVSVSRAKGQLIIIDSQAAIERFWKFATDPNVTKELMRRAGDPDRWRDRITYLMEGNAGTWRGERTDPREQGREYAEKGRGARDPYLLRQAALAYRGAGDEPEAERLLAIAFELETKWREAGAKYEELGMAGEAFLCYWKAPDFNAIATLCVSAPKLASSPEARVADFLRRGAEITQPLLSWISDATAAPEWVAKIAEDPTWRYAINKIGEGLSRVEGDTALSWPIAFGVFERLAESGIAVDESQRAMIAYRAGQLETSVRLWQATGQTETEDYRRAKARLEPFPARLVWLAKLRDYEQVLMEWQTNRKTPGGLTDLDHDAAMALADAAIARDQRSLAVEVLETYPERSRVSNLLAISLKGGMPKHRAA